VRRKRFLLSTLVALAIVLGAVLMPEFLHRLARSITYPGSPVPFPPAEDLARRLPTARLIDYRSEDGIALRGALVPAADPEAPVAIHFHGNGESAAQNLPFAADLARRGISVFLAEYRGYGGLEGSPTEDGLYADGKAAVETVLAEGARPDRLILIGRSLGSGVATELALHAPYGLLVLISPYTSIVAMGRAFTGPLADLVMPDRFDNLEKLPRVQCPVVILHGDRDEVIPVAMGRELAAAVPGITYVEVPGAGHNDFADLEELTAREIGKRLGRP
jgi:fermentation-respiration switch protein FrsA (DUF1100 family)